MKRLCFLAIIASAGGACGDTTSNAPTQLNLDRPIDIAFACYGGLRLTGGAAATPDQEIIASAQPIEACDIRSQPHATDQPAPTPSGQETIGTSSTGLSSYYGFILQSEPGTVALAQWDTKPTNLFAGGDVLVLDADPLTPGKNGITVGEDPIAIVTDRVGCFELTANAGSCDMSALDINSALTYATDNASALANHQPVRVDRIEVKSSTGKPVRARAAAMVGEPQGGTIGVTCPSTPTGLVYVAYPNCHLVAGIDTATGMIVTGIQYDSTGMPTITNGDVTCNDECGGGGAFGAGPRPIALDLEHDERSDRRVLAIGSENSNVVTMVELDLSNRPTSTSNVVLQQNKTNDLGVTSVSISPAIGMGGSAGFINDDSALGGEMQFIYAVATDHSVRVANIDGALNKECDTQVDPRYLHDVKNVKTLSCMDVGALPRRPLAKGPGIELIGDAIPTSVDVFKVDPVDGDTRLPGTPSRLIGYFGVITAANGAVYTFNVDNDDYADFVDDAAPIGTEIPLDIAHQLRDNVPERSLLAEEDLNGVETFICDTKGPDPDSANGNAGGPRAAGDPTHQLATSVFAAEKIVELPSVRQVKCVGPDEPNGLPVSELSFAAPVDVRDSVFPDLRGMRGDESLTMTWEGSLSIDSNDVAVDGPAVRTSQVVVDATGMYMDDQTHPYCEVGVEPYDVVQLRGCDPSVGDADCPIGYTCFVHPNSQVSGLGACMLVDEADRLANACKEFLTSLRRYTVGKTASGSIELLPRKHVLRTTPVDGCTDDNQCATLANYALQNASPLNPLVDMTPADMHHYSCAIDSKRKPELDALGQPMKRCIETCQADADCDPGNVCDAGTGYCMEGVVPPQACVNAPQRYEIRAGEAFTIIGTRGGYNHPIIADAGGNCVKNPNANPLQIGRIPLRAPACSPAADPFTGKISDGHCSVTIATVCDFDYQCPMTETCVGAAFDPNPCETTVDQTETQPNYMPGTCNPASPATMVVTRQADAIRFRNRAITLTIVDPTYPGDQTCIGDRQGTLGKIPIVPPLYETSTRITAGFQPQLLNVQPAYPVKVTRGPSQSIWVIDEGDYLSQSIATPSTRGKVYRVESQAIGTVNLLQ